MESDCRVDRSPDSGTPLLSGSATMSKRKLLKVSATIAAGAVAALAVVLLAGNVMRARSSDSSTILAQDSDGLVQDWVVPTAKKAVRPNPKMKYFYVKSSALNYDKSKNQEVLKLDSPIVKKIKKQLRSRVQRLIDTPVTTPNPHGWHFFVKKKPFQGGAYSGPPRVRSCGLESLVLQSNLVYDGWQECGYILSSGPNGEAAHGDLDSTQGYAVISAPPNNTDCTPDKMGEEPCRTIFTRTLARNHKNLLKGCLANVRGVSQTCNAYDRCGPHFSIPAGRSAGDADDNNHYKSVCHSSKVGYFKEPEIQRMCGVCDMFRATMGEDFASPEAGFKKDTWKPSAAGRTQPWAWSLLAAGAALATLLSTARRDA